MNRREWIGVALGGLSAAGAGGAPRYRAAIIGQTGDGDYGHDWDTAWTDNPSVEVVAVADADEAGRRRAAQRSRAQRQYADYREMLQKEKPNFVGICSRVPDQRLGMVQAAAEAGAHMLIEKPLAGDLITADKIMQLADQHRVKISVGFITSVHPAVLKAREMVAAGEIGVLQEIRARGKEDKRAGGEDMAVLGPHLFDLMRLFAGDPQWVFAHVTEDGQEINRSRIRKQSEPVGPIAGNQIAAMFAFPHGVHAYFGSKSSDVPDGSRFGFSLYGSKGVIRIPITRNPGGEPIILRSRSWIEGPKAPGWQRVDAPGGKRVDTREEANRIMAIDLIQAVEQNRKPARGAIDGRWTVEMLQGIYLSQNRGARVEFPLKDRRHPLEEL